jgi:uncharacterized membrane protein YfcA
MAMQLTVDQLMGVRFPLFPPFIIYFEKLGCSQMVMTKVFESFSAWFNSSHPSQNWLFALLAQR